MGSLFQLKKFWYTSFANEEFSPDALTCGNVLNEVDASGHEVNLIAIGSFQGHLRVWLPSDQPGAAQSHDLLFETTYDEPILQIQCGPYQPPRAPTVHDVVDAVQSAASVGATRREAAATASTSRSAASHAISSSTQRTADHSAQNLLAVLFTRRLMLLRLERESSSGDACHGSNRGGPDTGVVEYEDEALHTSVDRAGDGDLDADAHVRATDSRRSRTGAQSQSRCTCTTYYEVDLERSMYNFVSGDFGKEGYDKICAQSMDGHLFVMDHNKILYRCLLPSREFVLPGCLAYCALTSSILTVNSSHVLLCYCLNSIADASADYDNYDAAAHAEHSKANFLHAPLSHDTAANDAGTYLSSVVDTILEVDNRTPSRSARP